MEEIRTMLLRMTLATLLLGLVATAAQAQLVVGTDEATNGDIFLVDVGTGVATSILSGPDAEAWGLAYDSDTNTLYWNNGAALYSSPYSAGGLTPTLLGDMMFSGSTLVAVSLTFRDGMLYATKNISTEAVYEVDPGTLNATQVYVYDSLFDFGGLGVDVTTNLMYGLSDATGGGQGRGLYEIDIPGQTEIFRAPYPAGETDIDGLACYDGLAYYVIDQPGNFYIFDIASGTQVGTLPSPFPGSEVFSAATYIDEGAVPVEPSTWGGIKGMYR
jgi:hypothetical protein